MTANREIEFKLSLVSTMEDYVYEDIFYKDFRILIYKFQIIVRNC